MTVSRSRRRRGGFTLIEVLLVLVILVILGSLAVGVYQGIQQRAEADAARAQVMLFKGPMDLYRLHMRTYPAELQDLWVEPQDTGDWAGPYMEKPPLDPWRNEYQYKCPGETNVDSYDLYSMGPNGIAGDDDDIGNWE